MASARYPGGLANHTSPPFSWPSRIRFVDTDTSGRIHYTAMFRHFEAAEFEFLRSIGHPYTCLENAPLRYPRVHVECDFHAALRCDDQISTEVRVKRVGASSFTLGFSVRHGEQEAATGSITVVCIDGGTARAHPLPPELAAKLRQA